MNQDKLELLLSVKDQMSRALASIEKKLLGIAATAAKVSLAMAGAFAGAALGGVALMATSIFNAATAMETYRARLTTVLGAQEKVNAALDFLSDFARRTPFEMSEVIDAFTRLSAYGLKPTADRMRIIGDFAASMGRSFTDAVEAVADATRGEFERLKEFGLSKEAVDRFGKNLRNAQGQIKNFATYQEAIFKAMAARSTGAMDRMSQTILGKWSNLKDTIFRTSAQIGARLAGPLGNAITVLTRAMERLAQPAMLNRIGAFFDRTFTTDNIRRFAKVMYDVVLRIKDLFTGDLSDAITVVATHFDVFFTSLEVRLGIFVNRLGRAFEALARGDWRNIGNAFKWNDPKEHMEGIKRVVEAGGPGQEALKRMAERKRQRKGALGVIDELFAGLSDQKGGMANGAAANFGAGIGGGGLVDKIAEIILGGGQLAKLGIGLNALGGLAPATTKPIEINAKGAQGHFKAAIEEVAYEILTKAVRSGKFAMVGGR